MLTKLWRALVAGLRRRACRVRERRGQGSGLATPRDRKLFPESEPDQMARNHVL